MLRRCRLLSASLFVLAMVGCAGQAPLAVRGPLEPVSALPEGFAIASPSELQVEINADGLTVLGTRGAALNAATELHRRLLALEIRNQISLEMQAGPGRTATRLRVSFPERLTSGQRQQLAEVLARVRPRG